MPCVLRVTSMYQFEGTRWCLDMRLSSVLGVAVRKFLEEDSMN